MTIVNINVSKAGLELLNVLCNLNQPLTALPQCLFDFEYHSVFLASRIKQGKPGNLVLRHYALN